MPITFGLTTPGGSFSAFTTNNMRVTRYQAPATGYITRISYYAYAAAAGHPARAVIYQDTGAAPVAWLGTSAELASLSTVAAWNIFNFSPPIPVTINLYYWLGSYTDGSSCTEYYNAGAANQFSYKARVYPAIPNPYGIPNYLARANSIYATLAEPKGGNTALMSALLAGRLFS